MFGTLKGRILVILAVLAVAGTYLYVNKLKLGLDLQGGMHLALEVSDPEGTWTPEMRADATDRAMRIIRTRIDQFGVEEPLIQKVGSERIIVELPGIDDEERAKDIVMQTAYLEFQLVKSGREIYDGLPRIDRAIVNAVGPEGIPASAVQESSRAIVEDLLFGGEDTAAEEADAAEDEEPEENLRPLTSLLLDGGAPGMFLVAAEDVPTVDYYLSLPEVQRAMPRGTTLRWASDAEGRGAQLYRGLYVLEADPFMTGEHLVNATAGRDPQFHQPMVYFELNRRGGRLFERVTANNIDEQIAIVLDGEVVSAPVVRGQIGARGQIEMGGGTLQDANDLALVLRAGALPAPLEIVEERTVGPSLGQDAIDQGIIAGIVGLLLVVVVMVGYYRFAGFLAVSALVLYAFLVLGGLAALNATLTVPGIAGLILSIGLAVDANVLIFERIREELDVGRSNRLAVEEGFRNALSAIVDANLTSLITSLILFQFGTGPVRGFAVTLSIGIVASFFTAIYITRTFFMIYLQRKSAADPISI